jgi:hypothetical protein
MIRDRPMDICMRNLQKKGAMGKEYWYLSWYQVPTSVLLQENV